MTHTTQRPRLTRRIATGAVAVLAAVGLTGVPTATAAPALPDNVTASLPSNPSALTTSLKFKPAA